VCIYNNNNNNNNNTHKKAKQSVASGLSCQGYLVEKSPWNRPGGAREGSK